MEAELGANDFNALVTITSLRYSGLFALPIRHRFCFFNLDVAAGPNEFPVAVLSFQNRLSMSQTGINSEYYRGVQSPVKMWAMGIVDGPKGCLRGNLHGRDPLFLLRHQLYSDKPEHDIISYEW
jgi:hypothetical protein